MSSNQNPILIPLALQLEIPLTYFDEKGLCTLHAIEVNKEGCLAIYARADGEIESLTAGEINHDNETKH